MERQTIQSVDAESRSKSAYPDSSLTVSLADGDKPGWPYRHGGHPRRTTTPKCTLIIPRYIPVYTVLGHPHLSRITPVVDADCDDSRVKGGN